MPKRWSIQLTLQTSDDGQTWENTGVSYTNESKVYADDQVEDVEKKKVRIQKKAEQER